MKEVKYIQDIVPFLAEDFLDILESNFDLNKYQNLIKNNSNILKNFTKYIPCKLHDSWIIDFKLNSEKLIITLNDFTTHVFSDAIVDKYDIKIDHKKLVFPLILEFYENLKVDFYEVEENGLMKSIDLLNSIKNLGEFEYLGEQILNIKLGFVEIAFEFWIRNPTKYENEYRILIIVSANKHELIENQEIEWKKIFGNTFDDLYNFFKIEFEKGRYLSDYSKCIELIEEF